MIYCFIKIEKRDHPLGSELDIILESSYRVGMLDKKTHEFFVLKSMKLSTVISKYMQRLSNSTAIEMLINPLNYN